MLALKVNEVKNFMKLLFQSEVFDAMLVREVQVQTAVGIKINGHRNAGFYSSDELEELQEKEYVTWAELKAIVFQAIRGNKTPQQLNVEFLLSKTTQEKLLTETGAKIRPEEIAGTFLNMKFANGELTAMTGVAFETFVLDKSYEHAADDYMKAFLKKNSIVFEELA